MDCAPSRNTLRLLVNIFGIHDLLGEGGGGRAVLVSKGGRAPILVSGVSTSSTSWGFCARCLRGFFALVWLSCGGAFVFGCFSFGGAIALAWLPCGGAFVFGCFTFGGAFALAWLSCGGAFVFGCFAFGGAFAHAWLSCGVAFAFDIGFLCRGAFAFTVSESGGAFAFGSRCRGAFAFAAVLGWVFFPGACPGASFGVAMSLAGTGCAGHALAAKKRLSSSAAVSRKQSAARINLRERNYKFRAFLFEIHSKIGKRGSESCAGNFNTSFVDPSRAESMPKAIRFFFYWVGHGFLRAIWNVAINNGLIWSIV